MDKIVDWLGQEYGLLGLVLGLIGLGLITLTYRSYAAVLKDGGAQREELKASLRDGGDPRVLYVHWLGAALNGLDKLIGDQHLARKGQAHPDWNGQLFDVCARLALANAVESYEDGGHSAVGVWLPVLLTSVWVIGFALVAAAVWYGGSALFSLTSFGPFLIDQAQAFAVLSQPWIEALAHWLDHLIPG